MLYINFLLDPTDIKLKLLSKYHWRLNMNSQRIYSPQCLQEVLEHKIDYDQCQTIIEKERINSLDYLSRWINRF